VPGISLPCGLSGAGLPIDLQLLGQHWREATLFRLAHAYEQTQPLAARPRVCAV
jgi:Asp-tRNA(Asn)/Glu-tRNA(Gln) amidotransferase A subunit family amidase